MATGLGLDVLESRTDCRALLTAYSGPVLIVSGDADPLFPPPVQQRAAELFDDVEQRLLGGVEHFLALEAPGALSVAPRGWLERSV